MTPFESELAERRAIVRALADQLDLHDAEHTGAWGVPGRGRLRLLLMIAQCRRCLVIKDQVTPCAGCRGFYCPPCWTIEEPFHNERTCGRTR